MTLGNERVSLSGGGALWGLGPTGADLVELVRRRGGLADPNLRQRVAALHIHEEILRLIRLRTVSAAIRGEAPGAEASIRKVLADEHGQAVMALAHDLCGTEGLVTDAGPMGDDPGMWHYGWLFSQALTIGGGTGDVQRNIVAERVLGLPHDLDVEVGQTWAESRRHVDLTRPSDHPSSGARRWPQERDPGVPQAPEGGAAPATCPAYPPVRPAGWC